MNANRYLLILWCIVQLFLNPVYAQKQGNDKIKSPKAPKEEVSNYEKRKDFSALREEHKLDKEEMFKSTAVPLEWQDESVVILAYKMKTTCTATKGFPIQYNYIRVRVKLNDIAAVESFSDYDFDDGDLVEIKIIKGDGKIKKVNLDDAVSEGADVKMNKYSFSLTGNRKKIALKDLEVGDIIDYSSLYRQSYVSTSGSEFLRINSPVVAYKHQFRLFRKCYAFAFKSFNGCPDYTVSKDGLFNEYTVEASMLEKEKPEMLAKQDQSDPYFKYQLLYTTSDKKISYYPFKITRKEVKTAVTEDDLKYCVAKDYRIGYIYPRHVIMFEKKIFGFKKPVYNREYFEKFYYYLRDIIYTKELAFANEYSYVFPMAQFYDLAKKAKLKYEFIMVIPKHVGSLDQVLLGNEIYRGLRIHFPGEEPLLFFEFGPFTHINEYNHKFEGSEAYVFTQFESLKKIKMTKEQFPVSQAENNVYKMNISAVLNPLLLDTLSITQRSSISGQFKSGTNNTKGLNYFDYYVKYKEMLTDEGYITEKKPLYFFPVKGVYEVPTQDLIESEEQRIENVYRDRQQAIVKKRMKSYAEEEYEVHDYTQFTLLNDGLSLEKKEIEYEEKLKIGGILDKAGSNYILHIGKVFGSLVDISNSYDRKDRKYPFFIDFNRVYTVKLELEIPAGVKVSGLQALNSDVENEVGHFSVQAQQNGNVIEVTMRKEYKSYRFEASQWGKYLEFSDAGAAFINKKLVLTR